MLATGVDLVDIERLQGVVERYGERFLTRVYTSRELLEVRDNISSLAARFAAKEAVSKALGTGIGRVSWQDVEVLRGPDRQPILVLSGEASRMAGQLGLNQWSITLSHTQAHAIAFVVATD